jgi:hypothetical protein
MVESRCAVSLLGSVICCAEGGRFILLNVMSCFFNFILVFEVLMLSLQNHSNYHFLFLICLEDALCTFKILQEQHQHKSYWLIQGELKIIS